MQSRKTVNQIDVEIKNVGLSSIPLSLFSLISPFFYLGFSGLVRFVAVAITFEDPFYILRCDRDYSAKLDGAESLMMKVSRPRRRLKLFDVRRSKPETPN